MIITMHGITTMFSNVVTDIRIAKEAGYEALEINLDKLLRFLKTGFKIEELRKIFSEYDIKPVGINTIKNIEVVDSKKYKKLLKKVEFICRVAKELSCPVIQLVPLCDLEGRSWNEVVKLTAKNISEIADIGKNYRIRFQVEFVSWSPIYSLSKIIEVIESVGKENIGIVLDTWHLYAGEGTTPEEIAKLDKSLIHSVHISDGFLHKKGTKFIETELRGYMLGEGNVPIREYLEAIKSTGFDGVYSPEIYSPRHWEWDFLTVAKESRKLMEEYLNPR